MSGSKRYFGDLSKTVSFQSSTFQSFLWQLLIAQFLQLRNAGSSILFAAVTEVTDSVLEGAESIALNGMLI